MVYSLLEQRVLKKITPSNIEKKRIQHVVSALTKALQNEIKKYHIPIQIELVGSIAKDTYLRTTLDIDIFLLYPLSVPRNTLEKTGLNIGRTLLSKTEECYAEHPYVRGVFQSFKTEIVPCYKIESASQKLSAVDRTPLHTRYVQTHLTELQKNDVRLLKQFLRGIGCYGAEAEIEGFSGYLCEILIIKYGSFQNLIQKARAWKPGITIALHPGNFPVFTTSLVMIDPVDENRNVASALSPLQFNVFRAACNAYHKKQKTAFFFPHAIKPWTAQRIKKTLTKQKACFVGIQLHKPPIINENLYPQIRKATKTIIEFCERYEFIIHDAWFSIHHQKKRIYIILHLKNDTLPPVKIHQGPPIKLTENVQDFLQKWSNDSRCVTKPYQKNGRMYIKIQRTYTDIYNLLTDQLNQINLGKDVTKIGHQTYKILPQQHLIIPELLQDWTKYLDKKYPWER